MCLVGQLVMSVHVNKLKGLTNTQYTNTYTQYTTLNTQYTNTQYTNTNISRWRCQCMWTRSSRLTRAGSSTTRIVPRTAPIMLFWLLGKFHYDYDDFYNDHDHVDDVYDDFFDDHDDKHLSEGGSTAQSTRRQSGSWKTHGEKVGVR